MEPANNISGVILCGGKSSRMGKNKAFLEVDGIPIVQRIYDLFKTLFPEIIIVTNEVELFDRFEARIERDVILDLGALGGLYTGIYRSSHPYAFCVACDMPFLKAPVIQHLMQKMGSYDVVVPRTKDGLEPLHAIYSKNCLGPIRKIIEEKKFKILDFYPLVRVEIVGEDELKALDPFGESFLNVNTPEQLNSLRKLARLQKR